MRRKALAERRKLAAEMRAAAEEHLDELKRMQVCAKQSLGPEVAPADLSDSSEEGDDADEDSSSCSDEDEDFGEREF